MEDYLPRVDPKTGERYVAVRKRGKELLHDCLLNKGTAFSEGEREAFGLRGLIPARISRLSEQLPRAYDAFCHYHSPIDRAIYLAQLQDRNETLFYSLLQQHLEEMTPIIYTPTVAEICRNWGRIMRRARGLYLTPADRGRMHEVLRHAPMEPSVIVVTDNERILGIGDQGVGGMGIPIGKLSLYTIGAGIHPAQCLPISLDVGTNNDQLLRDPRYIGWREPRLVGDAYWSFVDEFVESVKRVFPSTLLQWEDFAKSTSFRHLEAHREAIASFNDDIQGTAAVSVAGLLGAMRLTGGQLRDQRIAMLGAGSAGVGIARLILRAMIEEGADEAEARARFFTLDSKGLVVEGREGLDAHKREFAVRRELLADWGPLPDRIDLATVVARARPTVLFGVSGQAGAFSEDIVRTMAAHVERPVILPLSNPTSHAEARPADLIEWTGGRAIVGTGSPFDDVLCAGRRHRIGQGNNVFIFPGVGLGTIVTRARVVTDGMFLAAASTASTPPSRRCGTPREPWPGPWRGRPFGRAWPGWSPRSPRRRSATPCGSRPTFPTVPRRASAASQNREAARLPW